MEYSVRTKVGQRFSFFKKIVEFPKLLGEKPALSFGERCGHCPRGACGLRPAGARERKGGCSSGKQWEKIWKPRDNRAQLGSTGQGTGSGRQHYGSIMHVSLAGLAYVERRGERPERNEGDKKKIKSCSKKELWKKWKRGTRVRAARSF